MGFSNISFLSFRVNFHFHDYERRVNFLEITNNYTHLCPRNPLLSYLVPFWSQSQWNSPTTMTEALVTGVSGNDVCYHNFMANRKGNHLFWRPCPRGLGANKHGSKNSPCWINKSSWNSKFAIGGVQPRHWNGYQKKDLEKRNSFHIWLSLDLCLC